MPDGFNGERHDLSQLGNGDVCKVLVSARSREEVDVVRSLMPAECACVVTDGGELVQIAHRECNKLKAVEFILGREGIELDETIAFGDDNNDIPLVGGAGCRMRQTGRKGTDRLQWRHVGLVEQEAEEDPSALAAKLTG